MCNTGTSLLARFILENIGRTHADIITLEEAENRNMDSFRTPEPFVITARPVFDHFTPPLTRADRRKKKRKNKR